MSNRAYMLGKAHAKRGYIDNRWEQLSDDAKDSYERGYYDRD